MSYTLTNGDNSVTVYGALAPQYVRTDKNGTMIYLDCNCPRCMGYGELDKWQFTGRICFACEGSGKSKPRELKVYTQEYAAKLEARRAAREAKRQAENPTPTPTEEELRQRADEARRNVWQSNGFDRDGSGYLYTGNTYPHRQQLRDNGGCWSAFLARWIVPVDLGPIRGVTIEKVHAADLCDGNGYIDPIKANDHGI